MPQDTEESTPLSVHQAFVVHFRASSDVAQGQVAGRVEHVVSGQAAHFTSLQELLTFVSQVLTICIADATEGRGKGHQD